MPSSKVEYFAFSKQFNGKMLQLRSNIEIFDANNDLPILADAIWDTGAVCTVITPEKQKALRLQTVDRITVGGINTETISDIVLVSIKLPNNYYIYKHRVIVADLSSIGSDILIGMDIISMGDFAISNKDKKTSFSFVVPSLGKRIKFEELL